MWNIKNILVVFLLLYVLTFAVGKDSNSFWTSYSFIIEHGLVISLLLLLKSKCETTTCLILCWGEIIRRIELIIFNLVIIPLPIEQYKEAKHLNSIILLVLGTIFIVILLMSYLMLESKIKWLIKKL